MSSPSNEQEIADIRRTLATLAERVVRLERKVMGRTLMEVFAEDDDLMDVGMLAARVATKERGDE